LNLKETLQTKIFGFRMKQEGVAQNFILYTNRIAPIMELSGDEIITITIHLREAGIHRSESHN